MDSKLIGSNIANCSRLQLIISCLQQFYKSLTPDSIAKLNKEDIDLLEKMTKQKAGQIIYKLDNEEKDKYLEKSGWLLDRIQRKFTTDDSDKYQLIARLFEEQYNKYEQKIELKTVKQIRSDTIQSAHDTEAAYRDKGGQTVKGYSVNITETCNKKGLNLIADVNVKKATANDNSFLKQAVIKVEDNINRVDEISADGAYNSKENQQYCNHRNKQLHLTGIQGAKGKYKFARAGKKVKITNTKTKYRGHYKTQAWAACRSAWINLIRIRNYIGELCPDSPELAEILQKTALYSRLSSEHLSFFIKKSVNQFEKISNIIQKLFTRIRYRYNPTIY